MPNYNLRFTDGGRNLREEGILLADDRAARMFAVEAARQLMGRIVAGTDWTQWRMDATDDAGRVVLSMPLAELSAAAPPLQPLPHSFYPLQP